MSTKRLAELKLACLAFQAVKHEAWTAEVATKGGLVFADLFELPCSRRAGLVLRTRPIFAMSTLAQILNVGVKFAAMVYNTKAQTKR